MSHDPRVDAYIANAAPFARPILKRLRASVHAACPESEEAIKWGMPFFVTDGRILCFMAAFKAHAGFGFWRRGSVLGGSAKTGEAMGQLGRITRVTELPPDVKLRGWIRKAASGKPAPMKRRRAK